MPEIFIATGPESTGKTTLSTQLAKTSGLPLVSEAARGYLEARCRLFAGYQYTFSDLLSIAMIQQAAEEITYENGNLPFVCDTDLLTVMIWSEEKFGFTDQWITETFEALISMNNRHYFLCHWDIPWQPDPLRENPDDRQRLYDIYESKLQQLQLPYTILTGSDEDRLSAARLNII